MSTRALVRFVDEKDEVTTVIYKHYDGYPEDFGLDLATFLSDMTIVNGISLKENRRIANGIECLAAQVVAFFKQGVGDVYIYSSNTLASNTGAEYVYTVKDKGDGTILFTVEDMKDTLFSGTPLEVVELIINTGE